MTMQMLGPWFTTTNLRNRKAKTAKPESKHDLWLRKKGLHPDQIKSKKVLDKNWVKGYNENMVVDRSDYVSAGMESSSTKKAEPKVYTGKRKLLGIATMHKSNMVPVFADRPEDAIDIARMRRG